MRERDASSVRYRPVSSAPKRPPNLDDFCGRANAQGGMGTYCVMTGVPSHALLGDLDELVMNLLDLRRDDGLFLLKRADLVLKIIEPASEFDAGSLGFAHGLTQFVGDFFNVNRTVG